MSDPASSTPSMANRTPLRLGSYGLTVRDLPRVADFYGRMVGLSVLDTAPERVALGIDGVTLLVLEQRRDAAPDDPASAGLFHTAFLMPTRADLADWLLHARRSGMAITRTGDHAVNEAIYFDDPEGNGVECYADRSPELWEWDDAGKVNIPSIPVDLDDLVRDARGREDWSAPKGLRIGHINVRVGDLDAADAFYCGALGLDHTCRRERMTFMSSGHYHHHMAANIFTSAGAGPRDPGRAGLSWFAFEADSPATLERTADHLRAAGQRPAERDGSLEFADPWGTRVKVVPAGDA